MFLKNSRKAGISERQEERGSLEGALSSMDRTLEGEWGGQEDGGSKHGDSLYLAREERQKYLDGNWEGERTGWLEALRWRDRKKLIPEKHL